MTETRTRTRIKKATSCEAGDHNFIVSHWTVKADRQQAISYICQRCLLAIEGKEDLRKVASVMHE